MNTSILALSLLVFTTAATGTELPKSLDALLNIKPSQQTVFNRKVTNFDTKVGEQAVIIGARAGYNAESEVLKGWLAQNAIALNRIFNFSRHIISHDQDALLLPPVIKIVGPFVEVSEGGLKLERTEQIYSVKAGAHFVLQPPSWQQELALPPESMDLQDERILPKDNLQRALWQQGIVQGWNSGKERAQRVFSRRVQKLRERMVGMATYRNLLERGLINDLFVAEQFKGVKIVNGTMQVGGKFLRIQKPISFETGVDKWKAVVVVGEYIRE